MGPGTEDASGTGRGHRRARRVRLAVLRLGHPLVDMYGGFLLPFTPVLRRHLDVRLSSLTALAGVCGVVVNGIQPLAGLLSPRFSRPVFLMVAPVLAAMLALIGIAGGLAAVVAGACGLLTDLGVSAGQLPMSAAPVILASSGLAFVLYLGGRRRAIGQRPCAGRFPGPSNKKAHKGGKP